MNVLFLSPGFPAEMPLFTRGLAEVGATVLGVGDQAVGALDPEARHALADYCRVSKMLDEEHVEQEVRRFLNGRALDRIECLWEPGMLLAARLRERFGVAGMSVEETVPFRDKETMKQVLDAHGIRTPHHYRARTAAEVRTAAERIGYPLILKPIAGAGSADTWPVKVAGELEPAIARLKHIDEVSVEEFIEGEEFTYDTVCSDGEVLFENVAWYRPKPLVMRLNPWMSPQAICLRDLADPFVSMGPELGRRVLKALGFRTGFTHMEWFRKPDGEAVFGEIGARSAGARLVHAMNWSCDVDLFRGWAEAVCHGRFSQERSKKFNAALVFKRAQGNGKTITRIEGMAELLARFGEHIVVADLVEVGAARRDPTQVVVGDGWLVARHPELQTTLQMADAIGTDLRIHAD